MDDQIIKQIFKLFLVDIDSSGTFDQSTDSWLCNGHILIYVAFMCAGELLRFRGEITVGSQLGEDLLELDSYQ